MTRLRDILFVALLGAVGVSCRRGKELESQPETAGRETATATVKAPVAWGGVEGGPTGGNEAEAATELSSTDPEELSAILREVDALARKDVRAAGRRAILALEGLTVADAEDGGRVDEDGAIYLDAADVAVVRALAEHVFAADALFGDGHSGAIPDELRETIIGAKVDDAIREGKSEEIGEWILSLADRDLADIAKWELIRTLYRRDGMPDAYANYPDALKGRGSDKMEAGQRFSVLEARQKWIP